MDLERERCELELSKFKFQRVVQEQQQVEESVSCLLRRLDQLPLSVPVVPINGVAAAAGAARTHSMTGSDSTCTASLEVSTTQEAPLSPASPISPLSIRRESPAVGNLGAAASTPTEREAATVSHVPSFSAASPTAVAPSIPDETAQEEAQDTKGTLAETAADVAQPSGGRTSAGAPWRNAVHSVCAKGAMASSANLPGEDTPAEPRTPLVPIMGQHEAYVEIPPVKLGTSVPADTSLLVASRDAGVDQWRGWTIQTTEDGRLFYHHAASETSLWHSPQELAPVLGEWEQVGEGESAYWKNKLLGRTAGKDPRNTTSVFQAALDGNIFFLQLYIEVGGSIDAVDSKGRSALHYNCAGGSAQTLLYLLGSNASVDTQDNAGSTPLHWACRYGHEQIVGTLLDAKADPDRPNALGDTCLHEAAALDGVTALHHLLMARADPSLQNNEARTPAELATWKRAESAAALLRRFEDQVLDADLSDIAVGPETDVDNIPVGYGTQYHDDSGSESETDEPEPSLALVIVRTARPLLRSVQWLANRVLGEKKANLGDTNTFRYDTPSGRWVLQRAPEPRPEAEVDESDDSCSEDDEPLAAPLARPSARPARPAPSGMDVGELAGP